MIAGICKSMMAVIISVCLMLNAAPEAAVQKSEQKKQSEAVTAAQIKEAAEEYIDLLFPDNNLTDHPENTPENSSWGPVWPKTFSKELPIEEIMDGYLRDALEFYGRNFWIETMDCRPGGSIFVREEGKYFSVWWIT